MVSSFDGTSIKRILDIGGDGSNLLEFKNSEKFFYDLSTASNIDGEIRFIDIYSEFQSLTPFDLIVSTHTLEHIVNLRDTLAYYTKLCREGSLFYVEVPMQYIYVLMKRILFPFLKKGVNIHWHINFFSRASLRALFEFSGYETLYFDTRLMPYGFLRMQVFVALFKYTEKASAAFTSRTRLAAECLLDLIKAIRMETYQRMMGRYPALRSYHPPNRFW
jgi:hypothetical protein